MRGARVGIERLLYLIEDVDKRGNVRRYIRIPGKSKVRIPDHLKPSTEEFAQFYWDVRRGSYKPDRAPKPAEAKKGTFGWLVDQYYASPDFAKLNKEYTQVERRRQLDELKRKIGELPAVITPKTIRDGVKSRRAEGEGGSRARKFLAALRDVYRFAMDAELVKADPTAGIRAPKPKTKGFHSWTLEECLAYEKRHPLGTMARTAYAVGLYTLARRSDAVLIGPRQVKGDLLVYRQEKNRERAPVWVEHPIVPPLLEALKAKRGKGFTWLETSHGKAFSKKGFGNWFADRCAEADIPHCSFHGLRKATAARMAEAGYSSPQIMAALGDKTLQQAEVYTRAASNKRMANDAMDGLYGDKKVPPTVKVARRATKTRKKT